MVFLWKLVLKDLGGVFGIYELLPAFVFSCIVIVVVSLLTKEPFHLRAFLGASVVRRRKDLTLCVPAARLAHPGLIEANHNVLQAGAIATVLAMQPEILALDEPSAGLDPKGRSALLALLKDLPQTMLIATHDLDLVRTLCTRVVVLERGRVIADGPVALLETSYR